MFKFEVPSVKLPTINTWLSPNYAGPGLLEQEEILRSGIIGGFDNPAEWKKTYSEYDWSIDDMMSFKEDLKESLRPLDDINANPEDDKIYYQASHKLNAYFPLKGNHGLIKERFGAEVVTNAWLKMMELCEFLEPIFKKNKKVASLSVAEMPGNFVLAINHWKDNNYSGVDWTWRASSYRQLYSRDHEYLEDQYGMLRKYPDNWDFSTDGDGDITSVNNITGFSRRPYHIGTGDVKFVTINMDYSREELINMPVVWGQFLCAIAGLKKGGCVVVKQFTFFEAASLCLFAVASSCFDKLYVTKPLTSRPANTEIYMVGVGYKKSFTHLQWRALMRYMEFIRSMNSGDEVPALFTGLPNKFVSAMVDIANELKNKQIEAFETNLGLFHDIKEHGFEHVARLHRDKQIELSEKFIADLGIKELKHPMR